MTEDENRSIANLIALCQPHSFEADQEPLPSVELLRGWRADQIAEYQRVQKSWSLTDEEVEVLIDASFSPHDYGVEFAAATSITKVATAVGLLAETARDVRGFPRNVASEWRALRSRVAQGSKSMWEAGTGRSISIEPSRDQRADYELAMNAALARATGVLRPMVIELVGDLHAVRAAAVHLGPWCEWIELAAKEVVTVSAVWQGLEGHEDQDLQAALEELSRATTAMSATWHGQPSEQPPAPQPQAAEPTEAEGDRIIREHVAVLEEALPWLRVDGRPYEHALCERLFEATRTAIRYPFVRRFLSMEVGASARLTAAVARNSDDATFMTLIESAAAEENLAVAVYLLREFMFVARATERSQLETHAMDKIVELLGSADWASVDLWERNRFQMVTLLNWTVSTTTTEAVRGQIVSALASQPTLLGPIILAVSRQGEVVDPENQSALPGVNSRITELPAWFPTADVLTQIHAQYPLLSPSDLPTPLGGDSEVTDLAQNLMHMASLSMPERAGEKRPGTTD